MLKHLIFAFLIYSAAMGNQKLGPHEHAILSKEDIINNLELSVPLQSGKQALCEKNQCSQQTPKITTAQDKATLALAVKTTCYYLVNTYRNTECGRTQETLINQKLKEFMSTKKAGYKHRALTAEREILRLSRQLLRAQTQLNNINARLDAYLQRQGDVPNQTIHEKISQIQGKIDFLREEILRKDQELLDQNQRIHDLEAINQNQAAQIIDLTQQVDDLNQQFTKLVDETIDLNGIVADFGLEIHQYTDQMGTLNGSIRGRMNQFQQILDQLKGNAAQQTAEKKEQLRQQLADLRGRFNQLTQDQQAIANDIQAIQAILNTLN